jgi:hypothetical protein
VLAAELARVLSEGAYLVQELMREYPLAPSEDIPGESKLLWFLKYSATGALCSFPTMSNPEAAALALIWKYVAGLLRTILVEGLEILIRLLLSSALYFLRLPRLTIGSRFVFVGMRMRMLCLALVL